MKNTYSEIELRQQPTNIRAFRHFTVSDTPSGTLQKPLLYDSSSTQYLKAPVDGPPSSSDMRKQLKVIMDTQDSILIKLNTISKDIYSMKSIKK